jgi:hypothetical protein
MRLEAEQTGPFYPTDSQIRLVEVRHVGAVTVDAFAL